MRYFSYQDKSNCNFSSFRGLKKKVGEYEKLTGELPGIWRIAKENTERALKAEKSLKEAQDKIEFLQKHHKESDTKIKKQVSDLKADNKAKERELKKMENELKRAVDKVAILEEKVVTIKVDFKKKEAETQIEHGKKKSSMDEKVKELRTNIQNKEDELSNTKVQLKDAKKIYK